MSGTTATVAFLAILTGGLVIAGAWRALRIWRRYAGMRLVTCPDTGTMAAVEVNARRAAIASLFDEEPVEHLAYCSLWKTRGRCDEACLAQVEAGGEDRSVQRIVERYYAGKVCRLCGKPIGEVSFLDHHAALADAQGRTVEWSEIPPEQLPDAMRSRLPVCWSCHVAESFRRLHPELVTDRPARPASRESNAPRSNAHPPAA